MTDQRRATLADFIAVQLAKTPKLIRLLCLIALPLCAFGLFILAGVSLSGSASLSDTGAPLVLFLLLTVGFFLALAWAHNTVRGVPSHPLVEAIRSDASRITRLVPATVYTRAGAIPGLTFHLGSDKGTLVLMNEPTRNEFIGWLSKEGAEIG